MEPFRGMLFSMVVPHSPFLKQLSMYGHSRAFDNPLIE